MNSMIKNSCLATVFIFLIACANTERNNNLEEDTFQMKYYDSSGKLNYYGKMTKDSIRVGRWIELLENGFEGHYGYMIVDGEEYLNQHWIFNAEDEVVGGHFIDDYSTQDTIILNEDYLFRFVLARPIFSDKSELMFIHSEDFNDDFSNFNKVEKDTVRNLKETNPNYGEGMPLHLMIEFSLKLDKAGDFQLRGVFQEINYEEELKRTREIFYIKNIYVKDTID